MNIRKLEKIKKYKKYNLIAIIVSTPLLFAFLILRTHIDVEKLKQEKIIIAQKTEEIYITTFNNYNINVVEEFNKIDKKYELELKKIEEKYNNNSSLVSSVLYTNMLIILVIIIIQFWLDSLTLTKEDYKKLFFEDKNFETTLLHHLKKYKVIDLLKDINYLKEIHEHLENKFWLLQKINKEQKLKEVLGMKEFNDYTNLFTEEEINYNLKEELEKIEQENRLINKLSINKENKIISL